MPVGTGYGVSCFVNWHILWNKIYEQRRGKPTKIISDITHEGIYGIYTTRL